MENINIAFCMKCKQKREIKDPKKVVMKRKGGKEGKALTGTCPVCGTRMYRILPAEKQEKPNIEKETESFDGINQ